MVSNFDLIASLLDFREKNTFYFIQLLQRRKENPEMKTSVRVVDNFYLYEEGDLEKIKGRIIERCMKHNARAYINLNRLDLEKVAKNTAKQTIQYIIQKNFKSVKNAYATVCGSHHSEEEKRWVVDIDAEHLPFKEEIRKLIEGLQKEITRNSYKILAEVPTRSGIHIITNPFNMEKFKRVLAEWAKSSPERACLSKIDVQKNSPTLLFYSDESSSL